MGALWAQVEEQLAAVPSIGGQRYVDRHRARGKMLVRERIEALVDPNTPLLELSPLAAWGTAGSDRRRHGERRSVSSRESRSRSAAPT